MFGQVFPAFSRKLGQKAIARFTLGKVIRVPTELTLNQARKRFSKQTDVKYPTKPVYRFLIVSSSRQLKSRFIKAGFPLAIFFARRPKRHFAILLELSAATIWNKLPKDKRIKKSLVENRLQLLSFFQKDTKNGLRKIIPRQQISEFLIGYTGCPH